MATGVSYETFYTNAGMALHAKLLAEGGESGTPFTRWEAGAGVHDPESALQTCTELIDARQSGGFSSIARVNEHNVMLRFMLTNLPPDQVVEIPYNITEIGIYAQDPDEGEVLYALIIPTDPDEQRLDQMSPYDGRQAACIQMVFLISAAQAGTSYIVAGSGAFALADEFLDHVADQNGLRHATIEIKPDAWHRNADDIAQVDIPIDWATKECFPLTYIDPDCALVACACGFEAGGETKDGNITYYAQTIPEETITVFVLGQRIGGVSIPLSLQELLLPATAERLGPVRIGPGVAADDDGVLSVDSTGVIRQATAPRSVAQSYIESVLTSPDMEDDMDG